MGGVIRSVMRYTAPQEAWEADVPIRGDVAALATLLAEGGALVLTGAGISTDSGIPDYRGPTSAQRRHAPMTYDAFVGDPVARHRYWARSHVGWPQIAAAAPNDGHRAVASLQRAGLLQRRDHPERRRAAPEGGRRDVVELHGALGRSCAWAAGDAGPRARPGRPRRAQPGLDTAAPTADQPGRRRRAARRRARPLRDDRLPGLRRGPLKPDVVFFGETVPRPRVDHCFELVDRARSLIVLGSSLTVMSGLRFVRAAARRDLPVAVVTAGPSRADEAPTIRLTGARRGPARDVGHARSARSSLNRSA